MNSAAKSFLIGFGVVFAGMRSIFGNQKIRKFAILPLIITGVVIILGVFFGFAALTSYMSSVVSAVLIQLGFVVGTWSFQLAFWPIAAAVFVAGLMVGRTPVLYQEL